MLVFSEAADMRNMLIIISNFKNKTEIMQLEQFLLLTYDMGFLVPYDLPEKYAELGSTKVVTPSP